MNFDKFHVIAVISNPRNFQSRYKNYQLFEKNILRQGAQLWTVEVSTGARNPQITSSGNLHHIQLWQTAIEGEVWLKEQLGNIATQFLVREQPDFRYVMYCDADFLFEDDFIEKTAQALQTWPVVQAWSHLINTDPKGHATTTYKSFMYCRMNGENVPRHGYPARWGSPGGAWAFRREVLNQLGSALTGPLIDFGIAGSGDNYMARAFVGEIDALCDHRFHPNYNKWLRRYGENCDHVLRRNVGYVPNTVRHLWHGSYAKRGYEWRGNILIGNQFDPETDLTRDASGLWRLVVRTPRQMKLRDDLRAYNMSREEDATTM